MSGASAGLVPFLLLCSCSMAVGHDARTFNALVDAAPDAPSSLGLILNEVAPFGHPDDWFEVYNGTQDALSLGDFGYSDSAARSSVPFSHSLDLQPGEYYVEYLSSDYPGFALGSEEQIRLYRGRMLIDEMRWRPQDSLDKGSLARLPDVVGSPISTSQATPGAPNREGDAP